VGRGLITLAQTGSSEPDAIKLGGVRACFLLIVGLSPLAPPKQNLKPS
jgi:hypothetical protein